MVEENKCVVALLDGKKVSVWSNRIILTTTTDWVDLPGLPLTALEWALYNEHATITLDVSFQDPPSPNSPKYFTLTPLDAPSRSWIRRKWIPKNIWVMANVADQEIYYEYIIPITEDVYAKAMGTTNKRR